MKSRALAENISPEEARKRANEEMFKMGAPLAFLYTVLPMAQAAVSEVRGLYMGPNSDGENRMQALREELASSAIVPGPSRI